MKKLLLFLLLPFLGFAQFSENFDLGIPTTWSVFPGQNGEGTTQTLIGENGYVFCSPETVTTLSQDWLVSPAVAITASTNLLYFQAGDASETDLGSNFYIKVSTSSQTDISTFVNKVSFTEANFAHGTFGEFYIDMSSYVGQTVYIAFVVEQNNGDAFYLDDVKLIANESAPNPVTTPTPAHGATNVGLLQTDTNGDGLPDNRVVLRWVANTLGDPPTGYLVYMGLSPSTLELLGETTNTQASVLGLSFSTKYYWKVIAFNAGGQATGSTTWNFTTRAPLLGTDDFNKEVITSLVYPNPAKDVVTIKLSEKFNEKSTMVSVLDGSGKVVATFDSVQNVNVKSLPKGVYILKLTDGTNTETKKIIKE